MGIEPLPNKTFTSNLATGIEIRFVIGKYTSIVYELSNSNLLTLIVHYHGRGRARNSNRFVCLH